MWTCLECQFDENTEDDDKACASCDAARPAAAQPAALIVAAKVIAVAGHPQRDKLRIVTLDIGGGREISVVTNAVVYADTIVCVALPGSTVTVDGEETAVKAVTLFGAKSEGMLCDCPMLGWSGGGVGTAATIPLAANVAPGAPVPAARPRGDAK